MSNGNGGPGYSPDGGTTWFPSNLSQAGAGVSEGLAVVDGGPYHGTAVATVGEAGVAGYSVVNSTDGRTWARVGPTPSGLGSGRAFGGLLAVPGGTIYFHGAPGRIYASDDAGRSWTLLFDVDGPLETNDSVRDLVFGPDGRLYAGVSSNTWREEARGGLYRTVLPVAVVSSEAGPAAAPSVGVRVRPNPVAGRAEAVVQMAEAGDVRLDVIDGTGRVVAIVRAGAFAAGETTVAIDTSGWAAGVYVARAIALRSHATASFTVAR